MVEEEIEQEELFVRVAEEEPFDYLDRLDEARMEMRDDVPGIVIPDDPQ